MKKKDAYPRVLYARAVYGKREMDAVKKVLGNPEKLAPGDAGARFEKQISQLFGNRHGVLTNSGSSANLLAVETLQLPPGSEVITPVLTFATTVTPLIQKGLTPVFVDVVEGTYQANLDQVEKAITQKTKAIMIPYLIGNTPDLVRLRALARKYNLLVIGDSCDTLGATFANKPIGFYTDITTTSFYASHIITAAGTGGMLCCHDDAHARRARVVGSWGRESTLFGAYEKAENIEKRFNGSIDGQPYDAKFIFSAIGYNLLSTEISAAFGLEQLKRLESFSKKRVKRFTQLREFFEMHEHFFILPQQDTRLRTNWLSFPLTIKSNAPFSRLDFTTYLEEHNIQTRPIFTGNILRQPAFENIKHRNAVKTFPVADSVMERGVLLGAHHGMTEEQVRHLKKTVNAFLSHFS